jgi:hypothetical protein
MANEESQARPGERSSAPNLKPLSEPLSGPDAAPGPLMVSEGQPTLLHSRIGGRRSEGGLPDRLAHQQ